MPPRETWATVGKLDSRTLIPRHRNAWFTLSFTVQYLLCDIIVKFRPERSSQRVVHLEYRLHLGSLVAINCHLVAPHQYWPLPQSPFVRGWKETRAGEMAVLNSYQIRCGNGMTRLPLPFLSLPLCQHKFVVRWKAFAGCQSVPGSLREDAPT